MSFLYMGWVREVETQELVVKVIRFIGGFLLIFFLLIVVHPISGEILALCPKY